MSTPDGPETKSIYHPPAETVAGANIASYEEMAEWANRDLEGFWAAQAEEYVWFEKWNQVLDDSQKPFYQWFTGGKTNIVYNCLMYRRGAETSLP